MDNIFKEVCGAITKRIRNAFDDSKYCGEVTVICRDKEGNLKWQRKQKNLRTNGGTDFFNTQLWAVTPGVKGAGFLALTTDTTAPAATDTTLTSEETTNGLQRTSALTPTHTTAVAQSVFANTFTYTGSSTKVIAKVGLFNDTHANGGTLVAETLLSSTGTVNQNGDTLTVTWTLNY